MKQQTVSPGKTSAQSIGATAPEKIRTASSRGAVCTTICCNICGSKFRPRSKLVRFCDACREESEEYHFCDWLLAS